MSGVPPETKRDGWNCEWARVDWAWPSGVRVPGLILVLGWIWRGLRGAYLSGTESAAVAYMKEKMSRQAEP